MREHLRKGEVALLRSRRDVPNEVWERAERLALLGEQVWSLRDHHET